MAVHDGGRAVGRPSRVCNRDLRVENLGGVYVRASDALTKAGDLADFLEIVHFAGSITVDTDTSRVVAAVFLAGETVAEDITDFLATLWETKQESVYRLWLINVKRRIIGGMVGRLVRAAKVEQKTTTGIEKRNKRNIPWA